MDYDYLDKLSLEELEWLAKYNLEEYHANFREEDGFADDHRRTEIYRNNYLRNNDTMSELYRSEIEESDKSGDPTEALDELIDRLRGFSSEYE